MPEINDRNPPVTQITVIDTQPERLEAALAILRDRASFMSRQPGFVSITLHRSLDGRKIVNYVQWETKELLQSAHHHPEFRKEWRTLDDVTAGIDPHLYQIVSVAS
ncbi:antibiotic biosynthesis monooxygenase [Roseiarcaceae bacterium H3SJ34-1]|uniref:antibiotic biosynthesis monooxygenase family protein n=1 Tax=Terripilifer ovatus TaxID=3032367 RepID=UPI003AB98FFB|nr:antibiotic biosynthesis monooxygenase [Roseiarcaceae bacterium H3SJ34-1]